MEVEALLYTQQQESADPKSGKSGSNPSHIPDIDLRYMLQWVLVHRSKEQPFQTIFEVQQALIRELASSMVKDGNECLVRAP
jgi:Icc-related predicted phosphoesterase